MPPTMTNMIPLAVPDLSGNEGLYLQQCITSTFVSSVGPFVDRFEAMVAEAAGAPAVATASGTAGLHAALSAIGVKPGELVVMPSLTFIATANAAAYCGAIPWLMDIEPSSWNLDPDLFAKLLAQECTPKGKQIFHKTGRRVAAVMPVHTLGTLADMTRIVSIARDYGLPVVADAAAALGASRDGQPVGNLGADLSVFSFNGNKTITCGGGGAVVGKDAELLALVRHLTTTARSGQGYDHDRIGFNYRMTNLQAAVGCAQMERLPALIAAKQRIRQTYDAAFCDHTELELFPKPTDSTSACWFSGVVIKKNVHLQPNQIMDALRTYGVESKPFWKPIHLQKPYVAAPRSTQWVSEDLWQRILVLPCSSGLTAHDQARSMAALHQILPSREGRKEI